MILNKGVTPIGEGLYRAVLTALATLVSVTLVAYQTNVTGAVLDSDRWKEALIAGVIAAVASFVSQTLMGASDQSRADHDQVTKADVPVAAEGIAVRKV